jgi:hypothetical protein
MWGMPVALDDESELVRDRFGTGVCLALLGHTLTVVPLVLFVLFPGVASYFPGVGKGVEWSLTAFPAGQLILPVVCVGTALGLWRRGPGRLGRGLVIGWFLGLGCAWFIVVGFIVFAATLQR